MSVPNTYEGRLTYVLKLCDFIHKNPNHENLMAYINQTHKWIDYIFKIRYIDNNYLSRFIEDIHKQCKNKDILAYVTQKIYENLQQLRNRYNTYFYEVDGGEPFATIFIDAHGKELNAPITTDTNLLSYNWSPASGIITVNLDDANTQYVLDVFTTILADHPSTFTEIINGIGGCIKTKYLKQLDEIDWSTDHEIMMALKYKKYSCSTIRPIKNKLYNFNKILSPGIYVLAVVNTQVAQNQTRLLNLLLKEDLETFYQIYNVEGAYLPEAISSDVADITLNDICELFRKIGITNLGVIDFSCRHMKNVCETNIQRQMVSEELGAHHKFRTFGGTKRRYKRNKIGCRRRHKTTRK